MLPQGQAGVPRVNQITDGSAIARRIHRPSSRPATHRASWKAIASLLGLSGRLARLKVDGLLRQRRSA